MKQTLLVLLCILSVATSSLVYPLLRQKNVAKFKRDSSDVVTYATSYNDGELYIPISMGTPKKSYALQVDTGFPDLVINSDSCIGCNQHFSGDTFVQYVIGYSNLKSKSFKYTDCHNYTCNGGVSYVANDPRALHQQPAASNSLRCVCHFAETLNPKAGMTGVVGLDEFSFTQNSLAITVPFGLTRLFQGDSTNEPTSGIFGLSFSDKSFTKKNAFDQIVEAYKAQEPTFANAFSICTGENPVIDFGNSYSEDSSMQWTTSGSTQGQYTVRINSFDLKFPNRNEPTPLSRDNPTPLNADSLNMINPTVIDTGMSGIAFTSNVYAAIYQLIAEYATTNYLVGMSDASSGRTILDGYCFSGVDPSQYPDLWIYLDGINDPIVVSSSVWLVQNENGKYCSGLMHTSQYKGNTLGNMFLAANHVVFDRENKRIGFGDTEGCPGMNVQT